MDLNKNHHASRTGSQNDQCGNVNSLQLVLEICLLLFNIFWAICEALIRILVPIREKSVKGDVVLITGAGHGIGKELALQYADLDAIVVCWDINEQTNKTTVSEIKKKGKIAYAYTCDITKRNQVIETVEKVKREVGNITILINNAGILISLPLLDHDEQQIQKTIDVNVMSHFWTLQSILPSMIENNHGHIVAISSHLGLLGYSNLVPYSASKFAVRGMMSGLYQELRFNPKNQIKLTTIFPYIVDTGLCKTHTIRFPGLFKEISPKMAASAIICAQRKEIVEECIPSYSLPIFNFERLFPQKVHDLIIKFAGVTFAPEK
ncbi:hypothetical protein FQR65_LT08230 [Abscondita terminalis]|nr:hypothetical protein FQR65_LT08230 [Abscondita terminalis]